MRVNHNVSRFEEITGPGYMIVEEEEEITGLDLARVRLVTMLSKAETELSGEERVQRLKQSKFVRLTANFCLTLRENQHFIPQGWEVTDGNPKFIYFDGTIFERSNGDRCVLFMFWLSNRWTFSVRWLNNHCNHLDFSAVVEK